MATEELETTSSITKEIHDLRETVDKIRYNELVHIEGRLRSLETKIRTPLMTLYLIIAFVIFIGCVAVLNLPASIGWSIAGVSCLIVILTGLAIFRTVSTKQ
jgi:hypothetical protein